MSIKHIDKGLDLLVEINAIDKWLYQISTNTYTVYGELRNVDGINHKIYDADKLSKLGASNLYAGIIADFHVMKEDNGKGFFYKVKNKLKKLSNIIIERSDKMPRPDKWEIDSLEVYNMLKKLMDMGKITREDMLRANELFRKYK